MHLLIEDNFLSNPDQYVEDILTGEFIDFPDGDKVFKGIQPRGEDEFSLLIRDMFPDHDIAYNFVRQSPLWQEEPNFIHKDDMMGDITAILYLNKVHPKKEGTVFYDENYTEKCRVEMKYNRAIFFNSEELHSRAAEENFGEGTGARLIQVIFLKKK